MTQPPATVRMDFQHLVYNRESFFYSKFADKLAKLAEEDEKISEKIQRQEDEFFLNLSHAVQINDIGTMPQVIERVKRNIGTDVPMNIFLVELALGNAVCMPKFSYGDDDSQDELNVLVSQHYMRNLDDDERVSVLGHELGHFMRGHAKVPKHALLESDLSKDPEMRAAVLHWAICCEVTCDIFGYIASGGDTKKCSSALLKYTTGLDAQTFEKYNPDEWIDQVLNQYETISDSVVKSVISTHPLTPLRLKILNLISPTPYLASYGKEMSIEEFSHLQTQFNNAIDEAVQKIYPELFEEQELDQGFILFYLGVATSLADGTVDQSEVSAVSRMISPDIDAESYFQQLEDTMRHREPKEIGHELVDRAVDEAQQKGFTKKEATHVVKKLLLVAAADGTVDSSELLMIFRFADKFGISKQELVYLANQVNMTP